MEWKVFYNSSCALQNCRELLVKACENTQQELVFESIEDKTLLSKGSLLLNENEELVYWGAIGQKPLHFSWAKHLNFWSREPVSFKKQPLLRALGVKPGAWVVDATCGTGADCSYLLHAGLKVKAYERFFPTFLILFFSYLKERDLLSVAENLELYWGDYAQTAERWECPIYFDPMFDDGSKRKALANKEMSLFHDLLTVDEKEGQETAQKLKDKTQRLVIKRTPKGPLLLERPNAQWTTKAVRFDLYI